MLSLVIVGAIAAAIVLGYRFKINIGLIAIAFSYVIGSFVMGMPPKDVVATWPLKMFFVIFSVCLFYSFALVNGTLEKLAEHLMYRCRRFPALIPFAIFLSATVIAALGAGYYTVLASMAPITLLLCKRAGLNVIVGGMAVNYGALAGANFPSSQSGIIFRTLMSESGIDIRHAFINATGIFAATVLVPVVVLGVLVIFGRKRAAARVDLMEVEKPGPFAKEQRITLTMTLIMMVIVLLPPVLSLVLPGNDVIAFANSKMDIGLVATVFSVIALLLRLGEEKKVMSSLPWSTIIMICGVGMLIALAIEAGTIDLIGSWIGNNIPPFLVPVVFGLVAAAMSLFASTLGVVAPALFPLVPAIASSLALDPMVLFIAIVVGSQATSISPFSSGGSLILGSCPDDVEREALLPKLLFKAAPIGLGAAVVFNLLAAVIV